MFPGDEGSHYRDNPGEGFAESYRALNDSKRGVTFDWPVVDTLFYPDVTALQAVEQDVLQPWTADTSKTVAARFTAKGRRRFTLALQTRLDGDLRIALSLPKGGFYELTLLAGDGRQVLTSGLWSGSRQKTLAFTICGQRNVLVRVTRIGAAGRFVLHITQP